VHARLRVILTLWAALLAVACSPPFVATEGLIYVVQPGDTLYAIAWRFDLDYRDVARWNGVGANYRVEVGQVLKISPDAARSAPPDARRRARRAPPERYLPSPEDSRVRWEWPATGEVIGPVRQPTGGFGLRVAGRLGDPVRAAAAGRVVYSGTALRNYGHLLIIKHSNSLLSAYGHNESVLVNEGQQVHKGQAIAAMGMGPGQRPALYFEIRLNGKPVDPSAYLPHRGP
jgi:lipoprotein NlpD